MPFYEHVYLARQDLTPAQVEALTEAFTKIITDNGGTVAGTEYWGLRNIAYRIAKNRKAHYVMLEIDAPGDTVAEIERQAGINEDIIRYMTVKVDALETGMARQERVHLIAVLGLKNGTGHVGQQTAGRDQCRHLIQDAGLQRHEVAQLRRGQTPFRVGRPPPCP